MLSSRTSRLVVCVVAASVVALSLTGCGTDLRPGLAASVNQTSITEEQIDELSAAACVYTASAQQAAGTDDGKPSLVISELKGSLLGSVIAFQLTDEIADQMGLAVSEAQIDKAAQQQATPDGMPTREGAVIEAFLRDAGENQLQQALIGAHLRDPSITTVESATQDDVDAAGDYLTKYFAKADVEVAPSYGTWDGSRLVTGSGSLSDPVSTKAAEQPMPGEPNPALESLPASQLCG